MTTGSTTTTAHAESETRSTPAVTSITVTGSAAVPIIIESEVVENVVRINTVANYASKDVSSDPADWVMTDALCEEVITRPIAQSLSDSSKSERSGKRPICKRYVPPTLFQLTMANGEVVWRE